MMVYIKRILAVSAVFFAFSAAADNNVDVDNPASPVTTTIEQPAPATQPTSLAPATIVNDSGTSSPSKLGDTKATNSVLSTAVDNVNADVKKNTVLIDDLSSQIHDLKTQIVTIDSSVRDFEDSSKGNFKILLSMLTVLLIISFVGLFKKCSCNGGPTQENL